MRIPCTYGQHVVFKVHVVNSDIPFQIGMEVLCAEGLILDFGVGFIGQRGIEWILPMENKNGHIFIEWGQKEICYTHV